MAAENMFTLLNNSTDQTAMHGGTIRTKWRMQQAVHAGEASKRSVRRPAQYGVVPRAVATSKPRHQPMNSGVTSAEAPTKLCCQNRFSSPAEVEQQNNRTQRRLA
jgi:hypothetical protein